MIKKIGISKIMKFYLKKVFVWLKLNTENNNTDWILVTAQLW